MQHFFAIKKSHAQCKCDIILQQNKSNMTLFHINGATQTQFCSNIYEAMESIILINKIQTSAFKKFLIDCVSQKLFYE